MAKGLFTSLEEISFQYNYVQGNAQKAYDPNTKRKASETKLSRKKPSKNIQKGFCGRSR